MTQADQTLPPDMTPETALGLYSQMVFLRRFEEKVGQLYGMGLIGGHCHLYVGQEAIVTGLGSVRGKSDSVITGRRDHAHALVCGADPVAVLAEMMGRETGLCGGRAGAMQLVDPANGFWGGHALPGLQVPIGAGLAFGARHAAQDGISLIFLGDGIADGGAVGETLTLAADMALPVVFVIENNAGDGLDGPIAAARPGAGLMAQAAALNLPVTSVDGMDVLAMRRVGGRAMAHARRGQGPALIEAKTDRYRGHSALHRQGDPAAERARKARDCIARFGAVLVASGVADADRLANADETARATVAEAVATARAAPPAAPQPNTAPVHV